MSCGCGCKGAPGGCGDAAARKTAPSLAVASGVLAPASTVAIGNPNDFVDVWGRTWRPTPTGFQLVRGAAWMVGRGAATARIGVSWVSSEELNAMNSAVQQFWDDVQAVAGSSDNDSVVQTATTGLWRVAQQGCFVAGYAWDGANRTCLTGQPDPLHKTYPKEVFTPALVAFRESSAEPFVVEWREWLEGGDAGLDLTSEFAGFKTRLSDLIAQWQQLGQTTSAVAPPVSTPGVGDQVAGALAWAPWIVGAGALAVGAFYLWPVVAPALSSVARSLTAKRG